MTLSELGNVMMEVRIGVLKMTQIELAKELNSQQNLVSRFERGDGGSILFFIDFINLLKRKGFHAHMLVYEPFDISLLNKDTNITKQFVKESLNHLQENVNQDLNKIREQLDIL